MAFPEYLKYWRRQRGMTQEDLAHAVGLNGQSAISNYERGRKAPNIEILNALADALQLPVGALIREEEFRALRDGQPTSDRSLQRVFHNFLHASAEGRHLISVVAAAAAAGKDEEALADGKGKKGK